MHNAEYAIETLDLLWNNYLTLCESVDLDHMAPEQLEALSDQPIRPHRISAWLARLSVFFSMWSLWEFYCRNLLESLCTQVERMPRESFVDWVGRSLEANGLPFSERDWFVQGNKIRNLIAHEGARVAPGKRLPLGIDAWKDGYLDLTDDHVAGLKIGVDEFVRQTAKSYGC